MLVKANVLCHELGGYFDIKFECRIGKVFTFLTQTVTVLVENMVIIMFNASDLCHYAEVILYSLRKEKILWLHYTRDFNLAMFFSRSEHG